MVGALEHDEENYRSRLHHFMGMHGSPGGRRVKSLSVDASVRMEEDSSPEDMDIGFRIQGSRSIVGSFLEKKKIASPFELNGHVGPLERMANDHDGVCSPAKDSKPHSDMEQMKERFAKLLLGEDMSGGGKGVTSALALSNAITNLAASVFGEQRRLEPMSAERKARWNKEIDWLLSVTDYVVEFVPSQQKSVDGSNMEVMSTQQRADLHINIPALRKLDAMLVDCLDNFKDQNEFYYISRDAQDTEKGGMKRTEEKWWLPTAKVPLNGLSEMAKKFLQYQKDCVNQVLKAAMAINAQVLLEMSIPDNYIESLPKNGRASLGDSIYKSITDDFFDPDQFLCTMDMTSEHKILDLKNKIEASIVIWKRKMNQKDGKSSWGSAVSLEKREIFEDRAETILLLLKQRFPGIPQSALDISKIQYNRDIGQAILESYSRILESLAFTVMSRIEDVLYSDYVTQNPSCVGQKRSNHPGEKPPAIPASIEKSARNSMELPSSMTLSDYMGWNSEQKLAQMQSDKDLTGNSDHLIKEETNKFTQKLTNIVTNKKPSYLDILGGLRSPTARH